MFRKTLYVQVSEDSINVRNIDDGKSFQRHANPSFSHPRMLVGNFTAADACLRSLLSEAKGSGFVLGIDILIHPLERIEGGLSQVEERLFQELARGAGAAKAVVWVGRHLSDSEVLAKLKGK